MPSVLYIGAGHDREGHKEIDLFAGYDLVTLDVDPACRCDFTADMTKMDGGLTFSSGGPALFDGIFSRHSLEHIASSQVVPTLRLWRQHLRPGAPVVVRCPDLAIAIMAWSVHGWDYELYKSEVGPIRPIDYLYGQEIAVSRNPLYQHLTGFDARRMQWCLESAGFSGVYVEPWLGVDIVGVGFAP